MDGQRLLTAEEIKGAKGKGYLRNKGTDRFSARVVTPFGRLTAAQLRGLAELAESCAIGSAMLTTRLSVEIPGVPYDKADYFAAEVAKLGLTVGGTGPKVRPIVSCKGTTCPFGLIDTYSLAEKVFNRFYLGGRDETLPAKFKIAIGGCPNNCVKPDLNDLGVVGKVLPDGARGYRILLGGHWGRTGGAGREVAIVRTEDEVLDFIERVLAFYRANALPGERFYKTLTRKEFPTC